MDLSGKVFGGLIVSRLVAREADIKELSFSVQIISTTGLRYEKTVEPFVGGAIGNANRAGIGGVQIPAVDPRFEISEPATRTLKIFIRQRNRNHA